MQTISTFKFKRLLSRGVPRTPAHPVLSFLPHPQDRPAGWGEESPLRKHSSGRVRALPEVKQLKGCRAGIKPRSSGATSAKSSMLFVVDDLHGLNCQLINLYLNGI